MHADEEDWEAVLAVSAELAELDPEAADPEGLATRARQLTAPVEAEGEAEPTGDQAEQPVDEPTQAMPKVRDLAVTPPSPPPPVETTTPTHPAPTPPPPPAFPWKRVAAIGAPIVAVLAGLGWWLIAGTGDGGGGDKEDRLQEQTTGKVTCWDGTSANGSANCTMPFGADGLATVFPSMDEACVEQQPSISDRVELFSCDYGDYEIRYSHWKEDSSPVDYFTDHATDDAETGDWNIEDVTAGETWTDVDTRPDQSRTFRWIAAYDNWPYDVTVKGVDESARNVGIGRVRARTPDQIGLG